ncbi:hypothetical protein DRJ24_01965 [Candidatus Acetothermia bacterium]|nr:MAG: hypothetical protein DRJ24_01965 [Candidatus Acetothermia bacterium]
MPDEITVVEESVITDSAARLRLWSIYRNGFAALNRRTPIHHGGFSAAQFETVLQDGDFRKFLVYVRDELVGVTLLTNALHKVPWVNAAYFEERYPDPVAAGKIYYLPAVVIDPKHQDLRRIGAKLLQEALTSLGRDSILAVDYSETLRQRLPAFVSRGLDIEFKQEVLDRLVYQIFYCEDPDQLSPGPENEPRPLPDPEVG